ncbi:SDR family NAD(P)-dependent oxidoreductase [Bradyrhizobium sp. BR 1432]|uniref:SDR family NAD(P)-dependent oxidoreductase n=1 Tax=Bradyrhizobium sp. BR 1432 TaxID=3447966 RepID=UPI003EE77F23
MRRRAPQRPAHRNNAQQRRIAMSSERQDRNCGSGFGEGNARKFAAEGARVVVADRDEAAAERVASSLHGQATAAVADISTESGFAAVVQRAHHTFRGLDILVNNAGVGHTPQPLETVTGEMFDRIASVNMKSIYYGAKIVVPHFKQQKYAPANSFRVLGRGIEPK